MYYLLNLSKALSAADQSPDTINITAPMGTMIITRSASRIQLSALPIRLSFFFSIFLPPVCESLFPVCISMVTKTCGTLPFRQLTIAPDRLTLL